MDAEGFEETPAGGPAVRGTLHRAWPAAGGVVLAHGAGSSRDAPLLVALARTLAARGLTVLRIDLPFRQARRAGPPGRGAAGTDREGLRRAAEALRRLTPGPLTLAGHSYGARQASILAAADPAVAEALLLLAYPLHPPGRSDEWRTAHFPRLTTPALFVHGTRDPFGTIAALDKARSMIPAPTRLLVIDDAAHDLRTPTTDVAATIAATVTAGRP